MNAFPSGRDRTRHPAIAGSSLAGGSNTAARHAAREQDREPELHRKRRGIKFHANTDKVNVVKDPAIYRADREMNLAHFKELMQIFRKSSNNDTGTISIDDFKRAFAKVLGQGLTDEQMSILFMKIDANTDNAIDWDDFSTYMLLRAEGQKLMREQAETQLFDSESAHHPISTAHKDVVVRIQYIESLKRYMSCSREGTVCYWNDRLKLQRAYRNAGQPRNELTEGHKKAANAGPGTQHLRWIHDAVFMDNVNKIALASDDHQITIYDGTTLQKALCLDLQNVNVMTLDYWTDRENPNSTESMLLYGTDSGCVNVFTFNNDKMFKVGVRQKDQAEHIFLEKEGSTNKALKSWGSLWKRRAHGDWTVKVKYVPDLHAIISCSPDPRESLVVAIMDLNRRWQVHVLPVHKGVNAFAFCRFPVALITGGTGHDSPIVDITVNELNGQVISLSVDKDIKIWDIRKQQCLQTITDSVVHRPEDIISAIMFNPHARNVVTGTYALNAYYLKEQTAITDNPKSHDFPIRAVMYNSSFKQIVSGCDGSVVNVWDAFSGQKTFRFSEAHGKSEITAMAFDASGRRLVTDGTIKIWNFNNGQLMQELVKKDKTEVTGLAYIDMRESTYFVATGWNRKITMFTDDPDSLTLYPTFTWPDPSLKGSALGWHEDDILSMVFCPPNILATSSYDGEIVICNLHSGHVLHRLRPLGRDEKINPLKSRSIDKVVFLQERSGMREAASLVSTGSDGMIRFWNIFHGTLMFEVDGTESRSEGIFTMVTNSSNTLLFTGDALGWVCVFDIHETALNDDSPAAMPLVVSFRAHVRSVTSMDIIEGPDVLVTCSADCTIRMFSFKGEYIGIFGQSALWELGQPASYMHPTKPLDVMQAEAAAAEAAEARAALLNGQTEAFVKPRLAASAGVEEYADDESGPVSTSLFLSSQKSESFSHTALQGQARAEDAVNIASPKLPAIQRVNLLPSLTASNSVNRSSNPTNLAQDLAAASKPRRVRTPELLAKEYGSWYAKSQYARDTFTNRTKRKSNLLRPLNIGPGAGLRVYHRLQPYDLADTTDMAEDLDDILDGALDSFAAPVPPPVGSAPAAKPAAGAATDDAAADLEAEFLKMLTENMEHLLAQPDAAAAAAGGAQQAAAVDEAGAIKTLEELRTAFESLSADFQGQIAQTMSKLRESSEKAAAQVAEDAKAAEDPAMASMMRDLEQLMQSENFDDIFSGFLDQLTKKEFLYDPLKDLADRYPAWLEANRSQLSPADNDRFDGQLEAVREILSKYDSIQGEPNEEQNKEILELLNKASLIQSFGNPPEALMKEMAPGLETDADGLPKMPQGACNPM
ncbi:hypothetical protein HK105_208211 [Polyrhizophydium stewartii]|uniref:EF-hand domain-containing protein n=1 Tax=Polyrhizophydium stewartii TaxID=2732419 RepID=A0ABR4MYE7_9FUNG